ncbi:MAG: hypothetical protein WDN72_00835 [Alphaproteobacteria bacterium]
MDDEIPSDAPSTKWKDLANKRHKDGCKAIGLPLDSAFDDHVIKPSTITAVVDSLNQAISPLSESERLKSHIRYGVACGFFNPNTITKHQVDQNFGFNLPDTFGDLKKCFVNMQETIREAAFSEELDHREQEHDPRRTSRYLPTMNRALFDAFNVALEKEGLSPIARLPRGADIS